MSSNASKWKRSRAACDQHMQGAPRVCGGAGYGPENHAMKAVAKSRPPTLRQLRVGEEIRHCLADVLARGDLRDPALRGRVITVSEVRVSPDLRNATVFVMPLGGEEVTEVMDALGRAAPFLRGQVSRQIRLKFSPRLSFQYDSVFDEAARVDDLLRSPAVARDLKPDPADGDGNDET